MVRTQIYLTECERNGLAGLAMATGKKQSELIRGAVDQLIEQAGNLRRQSVLNAAAGLWRDRCDLPDFTTLRKEWDRP